MPNRLFKKLQNENPSPLILLSKQEIIIPLKGGITPPMAKRYVHPEITNKAFISWQAMHIEIIDATDMHKITKVIALLFIYPPNFEQIIHLNTTMVDNEGYNISCIGAATGKFKIYRDEINLTDLRKETGSSDFAIFKQVKHKLNDEYKQAEKYENMQYVSFDGDITKNKDLFESILKILRKTIKDKKVLKQILSDLKKYIDNLMYQAKQIAKLSESDNPQIKQIGLLYKKAFEEKFNKKQLTQKNNHKRRY